MDTNRTLPLAIVGAACRLPGADGLDAYWSLIVEGRSAIGEVPPDRLDRALYLDRERPDPFRTYSSLGAVVPDFAGGNSYRLSPEEVASADPAGLRMVHLTGEALRDAGRDPKNPLRPSTGVYFGHRRGSVAGVAAGYAAQAELLAAQLLHVPEFNAAVGAAGEAIVQELSARGRARLPARAGAGGMRVGAFEAPRLTAAAFGFDGPCLSLDAACSSGLMALQLAALDLEAGNVDTAVVGGASSFGCDSLLRMSHAKTLSATGSRPFDDTADGLVIADGYVVLLVRTLARALADGDPIRAVIRGIGISSDGKGKSLWAPRAEGQLAAFRRAYSPEVSPASLQYLEAHATSTHVGDATELQALAEGLAGHIPPGRNLPIGSVKANIGHTLETAGLAGLLKVVLALGHATIPPNLPVEQPTSAFAWENGPFYLPQSPLPWPAPASGEPRRAGVNSFGIGGLNAHVVVEEFVPTYAAALVRDLPSGNPRSSDERAVAIVGLAALAPGALNTGALRDLLTSDRDPRRPLSPERCDAARLLSDSPEPGPYRLPTLVAGSIEGFEFDWRKHKIPPKQVKAADPLQFMVLDCVDRALADAGTAAAKFDRLRTAVVVGTDFRGEFLLTQQLCQRLPEILHLLTEILQERGRPEREIAAVAAAFRTHVLAWRPILEDETGSFTASTLASRVTKVFDWMGGAVALDAAGIGGLTALHACRNLLLSGKADTAICAAGQRSLSIAHFERAWFDGTLSRGGRSQPFDASADGIVPAEGAAVLVLKRLADALRDGDPIRGIVRGLGLASGHVDPTANHVAAAAHALRDAGISPQDLAAVEAAATGCPAQEEAERKALTAVFAAGRTLPLPLGSLCGKIGHTGAASGLLSAIKAVFEAEEVTALPAGNLLSPRTEYLQNAVLQPVRRATPLCPRGDGRVFLAVGAVAPGAAASLILERGVPVAVAPRPAIHALPSSEPRMSVSLPPDAPWNLFRAQAETVSELLHRVDEGGRTGRGLAAFAAAEGPYRATILHRTPAELAERARFFVERFEDRSRDELFPLRGIRFREHRRRPRKIAFLFPGQGSQYPGMLLGLLDAHPAVAAAGAEVDACLRRLGQPDFRTLVGAEGDRLGRDVLRTQLALLAAEVLLLAATEDLGLRPDRIGNHSFGEYAALYAAGAWDLETAFRAALARCAAIERNPGSAGGLLACSTDEATAAAVCAEVGDVFPANLNAPDQTVIGGRSERLPMVAERLRLRGVESRPLDVPRPFHTPLMQPIEAELAAAAAGFPIEPPRIPFLSSVSNRYVAEPDDIRGNLVRQLTRPVRFVDHIRRLADEGVELFVEIGPGQVLTRLLKRMPLPADVVAVPLDDRKRSGLEMLARLKAELELMDVLPGGKTVERVASRSVDDVAANMPPMPPAVPAAEVSQVPGSCIPLLTLLGTPFDLGLQHGQRLRAEIRRVLRRSCDLDERVLARLPSPETDPERLAVLLPQAARDELRGIAAGAEVGEEALLAHVLRTAPDRIGGCVQVLLPADPTAGRALLAAANEDLPAALVFRDAFVPTVQVRRPAGKIPYLTHVPAGCLGGINGINAAGITLTSSLLLDRQPPADALPTGPLHAIRVSQVLEAARTLDEALDLLTRRPIGGAWGICLSEAKTGQGAYVEATAAGVRVERLAGPWVAANHAVTTVGAGPIPPHSQARLERLRTLLVEAGPAPTGEQVMGWLADRCRPGGTTPQRHATLQTVCRVDRVASFVFRPQAARLDLRPAGGEFVTLDLQALLGLAPTPMTETRHLPALKAETRQPPVERRFSKLLLTPAEYAAAATSRDGEPSTGPTSDICLRFEPRLLAWPAGPSDPARFPVGRVLLWGDHPFSRAVAEMLRQGGAEPTIAASPADPQAAVALVENLWAAGPIPHFVWLQGDEPDRADWADWADPARRWEAVAGPRVLAPYAAARRWYQLLREADLVGRGSFFACTALGGDLGFGGTSERFEEGVGTGLGKCLFLEHRETPGFRSRTIDFDPADSPAERAEYLRRELMAVSQEREVAWNAGRRFVARPIPLPIQGLQREPRTFRGPWLVTGGARGVTAETAKALGQAHGMRLHLLGSSPLTEVPAAWRELDEAGLKELKAGIVREALARKETPAAAWGRVERALEIDRNLRTMRAAGLRVTYHACDVADRRALAAVLSEIRRQDGPLEGIVHGAGFESSARFDRKKLDAVERTFRVKVTGAVNLFDLTRTDPLRCVFLFGSISGRFGSIGQTDYSAANEVLARLGGRWGRLRPEVEVRTFGWHSWGDVGMAMRPETRHAKALTDLRYMPAAEGARHLVDELAVVGGPAEITITDWRYFKRYYPDPVALPPAEVSRTEKPPADMSPQESQAARRRVWRCVPKPAASASFVPAGPVLILGGGADAGALELELRSRGAEVFRAATAVGLRIEQACDGKPPWHLFVLTCREPEAADIDRPSRWKVRREAVVEPLLTCCRAWLAVAEPQATIAVATALGGDFGCRENPEAIEGAMFVDALRPAAGGRLKGVDFSADVSPGEVARRLIAEAAGPDERVAYRGSLRQVPCHVDDPAPAAEAVLKGGHWLAFGLSAPGLEEAAAFARRQGLKLAAVSPAEARTDPLAAVARLRKEGGLFAGVLVECGADPTAEIDSILRLHRAVRPDPIRSIAVVGGTDRPPAAAAWFRTLRPDVANLRFTEPAAPATQPVVEKKFTPALLLPGEPPKATLDPVGDAFLTEHRFRGRPLLPLVAAAELLAEAALTTARPGERLRAIVGLKVTAPLRFARDETLTVSLTTDRRGSRVAAVLTAPLIDSRGRTLLAARPHFSAEVELGEQPPVVPRPPRAPAGEAEAGRVPYRDDLQIQHGPLYRLLETCRPEGRVGFFDLTAPDVRDFAPARPAGWSLPCAVLDACLYAAGVVFTRSEPQVITIPTGIDRIDLVRLPHAGERCSIVTEYRHRDEHGASFDITLVGADGESLVRLTGYRCAAVTEPQATAVS